MQPRNKIQIYSHECKKSHIHTYIVSRRVHGGLPRIYIRTPASSEALIEAAQLVRTSVRFIAYDAVRLRHRHHPHTATSRPYIHTYT
uniref:Uncharacterized protein n=1 Tax=Trichogramma kaykai TaxID=54128 RepID=A0ABD2XI26_9HYME